MGKGNRKGRGGTVWYSNLCAFLIVLLWRDKIHGKGFKLGRNVVALSGTSIFLFHLNPHSLVLLAFPKPMFVCLSGLRLERLENHHLFLDNLVEKGWKTIPKFIVFDWNFWLTSGNPVTWGTLRARGTWFSLRGTSNSCAHHESPVW